MLLLAVTIAELARGHVRGLIATIETPFQLEQN